MDGQLRRLALSAAFSPTPPGLAGPCVNSTRTGKSCSASCRAWAPVARCACSAIPTF